MRGPTIPYMLMRQYWEQSFNGISWHPLSNEEQQYYEKLKKVWVEQQRKFYAKIANPFNLCPIVVSVWFPVFPSVAIGLSFSSLNDIGVYLRQAIEPTFANGFTAMKLLELRVPYPLTFLAMFSAVGLFFNAKIHKLLQESNNELIGKHEDLLKGLNEKLNVLSSEEDSQERIWKITPGEKPATSIPLNPSNLSPLSMSVFVPIYQKHTALGILFHDLNFMGISVLQALEPNDKIYSLFRFIHIQVPYTLDLLALFLVLGLFFSGAVNKVEQGAREEIIKEVKESIKELKKNY